MPEPLPFMNRRTVLLSGAAFLLVTAASAQDQVMTVHKDPSCGCCTEWVKHLQQAGFVTRVTESRDLDRVKTRLGVPPDLAACHSAEIGGYLVEGHVPAEAIKRLLGEKPAATGIAVPGMPVGSPGMEGGRPEMYEVVLFGPNLRRPYMRFIGDRAV
jgi:hypothetical protein